MPTDPPQHPPVSSDAASGSRPWGGALEDGYFLGRYRVVSEIGRGGMARVYLARMDSPGGFLKWVAIKRIRPRLKDDERVVKMFLDEARIAARITHPNVAQVFELGVHEDTYWIVMEFLHGDPVREIMRWNESHGRRTPAEIAACIIADAAEGLHAAHELRDKDGDLLHLVHRDVTPHNLFLTYDGQIKVVDFGVAKVAHRWGTELDGPRKGKLAYMAPEQVRGGLVDRRADVFALGVVLWELLTGKRLFRRDEHIDTLAEVLKCNVPTPSDAGATLSPELEKVVLSAVSKRSEDRHATALEFSRALRSVLIEADRIVGPEELSAYIRGLFTKRIAKRERYLSTAAELSETLPRIKLHGATSDPPDADSDSIPHDDDEVTMRLAETGQQDRWEDEEVEEVPTLSFSWDPPGSRARAPDSLTRPLPRSPSPPPTAPRRALPRMSDSEDERREHERHRAAFPARVLVDGGEVRPAMIHNLSVKGALLLMGCPLPDGIAVRVELFISRDPGKPRVVAGKAARSDRCGEGAYMWTYKVAIEFIEPATAHEEEIRAVAEEQAKMGVVRRDS